MALWLDEQDDFLYSQNVPSDSAAEPTAVVTDGYHHGWLAPDHGDEASLSLDFDYDLSTTTITPSAQAEFLDLQYNFAAYQASPVKLPAIRVHIDVS